MVSTADPVDKSPPQGDPICDRAGCGHALSAHQGHGILSCLVGSCSCLGFLDLPANQDTSADSTTVTIVGPPIGKEDRELPPGPTLYYARYDLIEPGPLRRIARRMTLGDTPEHGGAEGWKKRLSRSTNINHIYAHLEAWRAGHHNDDHLAGVAARIIMEMWFEENEGKVERCPDSSQPKAPSPPQSG